MRLLLLLLFLLMYSFNLCSQVQRCSTDEYRQNLKNKGLYNNHNKHNNPSQSYTNTYDIPIVIHVLYNTEEQNISDDKIYSQLAVLNNDYNGLNLEIDEVPEEFQDVIGFVGFNFCLVQEDLNGNPFNGVNRVYTEIESFQGFNDEMKKSEQGGVDAWDSQNYLNIWVCNLSGNTLGFATMPGDVSEDLDGVVIDYEYFGTDLSASHPYNLGRTATHEIGHYFNLEHTFYAGCSDWDDCEDTPPLQSPTYGCPNYPDVSCASNNMTMNYMDYTNDACMSMFTVCQANRMIDALLTYRSNLIADINCSVAIHENTQSNSFSFYPNPVIDVININKSNTYILISDIYGRSLMIKYIEYDNQLDVSFLPPGTYFLSIGGRKYTLIKQSN